MVVTCIEADPKVGKVKFEACSHCVAPASNCGVRGNGLSPRGKQIFVKTGTPQRANSAYVC